MRKQISLFLTISVVFWAYAGTINGIVYRKAKPIPTSSISRYSGRASIQHQSHQNTRDNDQAIVYLTSPMKTKYAPPALRPRMEQINESFDPWLLPILVGTTVDFPNSDPIFHNVFSYSNPKKFDLGRYSKGESKSVTFERPGMVKVFCEIHKGMRAYILVLENPYFTLTDESGHYILKNVPQGNYTLNVWQENLPEYSQEITVADQDTLFIEIR
jgi:plastocyanin